MLPILAAIGVSVLSTLAGKAATALIERNLGGIAAADSGKSSFDMILERSQTTRSNRAYSKGLDRLSTHGLGPTVASSRTVHDQIGRTVSANGSVIDLRGPVPPTLRYHLPTTAASVQIEVRDLEGQVVRTIRLGPQSGGLHRLPFDGRGLQSGLYVYRIVASDARGLPIARVSTASGRVSEARFDEGQTFLVVGTSLVPLAAVVNGDQQSAFS